MIALYAIITGMFIVLSVVLYKFAQKSYNEYINYDHSTPLKKENRLYNLIFSSTLCVTTTILSCIYMLDVFLFAIGEHSESTTLSIIEHITLVVFITICLLFLKHCHSITCAPRNRRTQNREIKTNVSYFRRITDENRRRN